MTNTTDIHHPSAGARAKIVDARDTAVAEAARCLAAGRLVAFPTETVYGLGADAGDGRAVARIFASKNRPPINPLIVHVADLDAARRIGVFNADAVALGTALWPGPLTLVVPLQRDSGITDLVSAGLSTIALRVPSHAVAQALLRASGRPLAAPSANRSGHVSATTAIHVATDLAADDVAMILDGGASTLGIESTILDVTTGDATLLRPGAISTLEIETLLGRPVRRGINDSARPTAPGQLESHYAPKAHLRLNATSVAPGEAVLGFGPEPLQGTAASVNLSPSGDCIEAAARLFSALRHLDGSGVQSIAVMPIPEDGVGEAINDRLRRAAAPRLT